MMNISANPVNAGLLQRYAQPETLGYRNMPPGYSLVPGTGIGFKLIHDQELRG
jgi:hypothetical protein